MAGLRHQVLEDNRVLISLVSMTPASTRVTASEARRFAYGLLADLEDPSPLKRNAPVKSRKTENLDRRRAEAMRALSVRSLSTNEIAERLKVNHSAAYDTMASLGRKGLVSQKKGGGGTSSIWKLTPAGRQDQGLDG